MKIIKTLTALVLLFTLLACRERVYTRHLCLAAQLMLEQPDSALRQLRAVNFNQIHGRTERAKYALLYSEALERSHTASGSDSLISSALAYYEEHGAPTERARANYYLARIYLSHGEWEHTLRACVQAEEHADRVGNRELSGAIAAVKGGVYFECGNYPHAITAYSEAFDHHKQARNDSMAMIVCNELSRAYALNNNQPDTKRHFEQTRLYAEALHDTVNMLNAVRSLASYHLYESDSPVIALETLQEGYAAYADNKAPVSDYPLLSIIHSKLNQPRSAWRYAHDYFDSQQSPAPCLTGYSPMSSMPSGTSKRACYMSISICRWRTPYRLQPKGSFWQTPSSATRTHC